MTAATRPAKPADCSEIARLYSKFYLAYHRGSHLSQESPPMVAETFRHVAFSTELPLLHIAVADDALSRSPRLVGYAAWSPVFETDLGSFGGYLTDLFVEESHRHKGLGLSLLSTACNMVRQNNGAFLFWHSSADNSGSRRFYEPLSARVGNDVIYIAAKSDFQRLCSIAVS